MVAAFVIWGYIFLFSFIYGWTVLEGLKRLFSLNVRLETISIPIILLVGLSTINSFAAFFSLFINLGLLAQLVFLLVGLTLGFRMRQRIHLSSWMKQISTSWQWSLFFIVIFLTILINSIGEPTNPDTGIYHAQAIRWMELYPVVPGLGNLHSRLAFNSNWLVLNAFFSFSFLNIKSFHLVPGAFMVMTMAYFYEGVIAIGKKKITAASVFKVFLIPLIFYVFKLEFSSPGTDLPAAAWILITFALLLDTIEPNGEVGTVKTLQIIVMIFSVYTITTKLSALPLILLGFLTSFRFGKDNPRHFIKLTIPLFFILIPWLVRNLILSGYWIYPLPILASLSPNWDWKIPLEKVIAEKQIIQAWARNPRAYREVMNAPLSVWIKEWFFNHTNNQRLLLLTAFGSPVFFIASFLLALRRSESAYQYASYYLVSYCGLLFWLFGGPDIRFGFGFILSAVVLSTAPLICWIILRMTKPSVLILPLLMLVALFQVSLLYKSIKTQPVLNHILLPAEYKSLSTQPCEFFDFKILCAANYDECWYAPFPCVPPSSASLQVEMRGSSFREGFRSIQAP